jgi:hypothetical protein
MEVTSEYSLISDPIPFSLSCTGTLVQIALPSFTDESILPSSTENIAFTSHVKTIPITAHPEWPLVYEEWVKTPDATFHVTKEGIQVVYNNLSFCIVSPGCQFATHYKIHDAIHHTSSSGWGWKQDYLGDMYYHGVTQHSRHMETGYM